MRMTAVGSGTKFATRARQQASFCVFLYESFECRNKLYKILFNIKFNGDVKLKSIIVIGGDDDLEPIKLSHRVRYIKLF